MSERLLLDHDAFFTEHRRCGDLGGDATDERAWMACSAVWRDDRAASGDADVVTLLDGEVMSTAVSAARGGLAWP